MAEPFKGFQPSQISSEAVLFGRLQPGRTKFGKLHFRGGLLLTSNDSDFGGLSGLGISADGVRLLAISDEGHMFSADLHYADGMLAGVKNGAKSSLKGSKGQPLPKERKAWHDAEGLALGPEGFQGPLWVSFERNHRIETYDFGRQGANSAAKRTKLPAPLNRSRSNSGMEALARFGPETELRGALIGFAEHQDDDGFLRGAIIGGPKPGPVKLRDPGDYSATGAAFLPDGDLIMLERRLGNIFDFSIRIRRIKGETLRANATLDAETLFEGGLAFEIDNFEGVSVHQTKSGEIRLTLVSDDNFSPIQQTLLMQFALID